MNNLNAKPSHLIQLGLLLIATLLPVTSMSAQTVKSVTLNPNSVGGVIDSTGTVTLSSGAPQGGAVVALASSDPSTAQVPATVTVPQGKTQANFTVTTSYVTGVYKVTISAKYKTSDKKATLTVRVPIVQSIAGGYTGDNQSGLKACLEYPQFASLDSAGDIYIADDFNNRIREYNATTQMMTTVAGTGFFGYNGEGVKATEAHMGLPRGVIVFDAAGDFYYTDDGNNRIRAAVGGVVNTILGTGTAGYSGDGGVGTNAEINQPTGLALDASGNLYFSDTNNAIIRMWNPSTQVVTTVAGTPQTPGYGGDGGSPTSALLRSPRGIGFDSAGNLYIADTNNSLVRIVTGLGMQGALINTIAGQPGNSGFSGDGGQATNAAIGLPRGVLVSNGLLYISNAGHIRVRTVNLSSGIINTFAGSWFGYDGEGNAPLDAEFEAPTGILAGSSSHLLVVDSGQARVRDVNPQANTVRTIIGGYRGDGGKGTNACLDGPENLALDKAGNVYVAESNGNHVRKVAKNGTITTLVDTSGIFGYDGDGGTATYATIAFPQGVATDPAGNLYVADNINSVIRKVNTHQVISTFASDPLFNSLTSVATDAQSNVYAVDQLACVVWEITPSGVTSILAGVLNNCGYNGDGIPATTADLNQPYGVAVDSTGNVYIGDTGNNRVRIVDTSGNISTFAGTGVCQYSGDGGPAKSATLCMPYGVAVDPLGRLFIADYNNSRIRLVDNSGTIYTYIGNGLQGYNGEGKGARGTHAGGPVAVAVGPNNVLYHVDDMYYRVRKVE